MKHVNCPDCGASEKDIEYGELVDYHFEPTSYFAYWNMVCTQCGKVMRMTEVYRLEDIELQEDTE